MTKYFCHFFGIGVKLVKWSREYIFHTFFTEMKFRVFFHTVLQTGSVGTCIIFFFSSKQLIQKDIDLIFLRGPVIVNVSFFRFLLIQSQKASANKKRMIEKKKRKRIRRKKERKRNKYPVFVNNFSRSSLFKTDGRTSEKSSEW